MGAGVAGWCLFAVLAVALRGVRWDEAFEHAQIMAGQVLYPAGHPLAVYLHNAFSLQTYSSALVVSWFPGTVVLCGLRNVAYLLATVLPVFLFAAHLSRRVLWGTAAALLTLQGLTMEFDSSYPLSVWPETFTNGHIGAGFTLLTLYVLLIGKWRWGFFLLGLAPAVHIGQVPPLFLWAGARVAWLAWRGETKEMRRALPWGALGLGLCVLMWFLFRSSALPFPQSGPFYSPDSAGPIWRGFTAHLDMHRHFPPGNAHVALVAALILGAGLAWRDRNQRNGASLWLLVFVVSVAVPVASAMAIHYLAGAKVPFLVIGWMPYRLMNMILPVLLAFAVGTLGRVPAQDSAQQPPGVIILTCALTACVAMPLLGAWVPASFYGRYVAGGDGLMFGLLGAAWGMLSVEFRGKGRASGVWISVLLVSLASLALYHRFGAVCCAGGACTTLALARLPRAPRPIPLHAIATLLCVVLAVVLLYGEARTRRHLPKSEFDKQITETLRQRGDTKAMLAARPNEFLLQARTGHPVLVEAATASLMSYLPSLGPCIQKIYVDIYGIRFDTPPEPTVGGTAPWLLLWQERPRAKWLALAEDYGFSYVVAPPAITLDLPLILDDTGGRLYYAGNSTEGEG